MIICIILVPPDIISHYKLNEFVDQDGWVYMEIIKRNVRITTIGNPCKQLTCALFPQPWILPSQTHTSIMKICVKTYFFHIGSG